METTLGIRSYTDYRTFLVAHAQEMKNHRKEWSYGIWAQRMGLKATSSLTKILSGDREPGEQMTEQFISYFKFREKEALYFKDLIRLSKVRKDPRLSVLLLEKMSKQHPSMSHRLLDDKTFSVISNWFYLPLREFTRVAGFQNDPEWIAKNFQFKITPREVSQAIDNMISLGLLDRSENGWLNIREGRLATDRDVASEAVKRYHEQMLDNAKNSLRTVPLEERELTAESLVINTQNIPQAKEMIQEFREKFSKLFEEQSGDSVYQIQIQFFPLTKKNKRQM